MPLARIDISKDASAKLVRIVSEAVYKAMVEVANGPVHGKFQVINRNAGPDHFPGRGISRTELRCL